MLTQFLSAERVGSVGQFVLIGACLAVLSICSSCNLVADERVPDYRRSPDAVVRGFYTLMAQQRCAEAGAVRPGYDLRRCKEFELLEPVSVSEEAQIGDVGLVALRILYRMKGQAAEAEGCVQTQNIRGGWIYKQFHSKQSCATVLASLDLGRATARHRTAATPVAGFSAQMRDSEMSATPVVGVDPGTGRLDLEPDRSGAHAQAASGAAVAVVDNPTHQQQTRSEQASWRHGAESDGSPAGNPEAVVRGFYQALDRGDCETARQLRPGYPRCASFDSARVAKVRQLLRDDAAGVSVVAFTVRYRLRDKDEEAPAEHGLNGLAWLDHRAAAWLIREVYGQDEAALVSERFARVVSGTQGERQARADDPAARTGGQHGTSDLAIVERRSSDERSPAPWTEERLGAPASVPDSVSAARLPVGGGSTPVLERCWSPSRVRGSPVEKRIQTGLTPTSDPPPAAYIEQAENALGGFRYLGPGSIRWVDLRDPDVTALALTFDLCEQADEVTGYDGEIVDFLRDKGVKATFYAGGKWMASHPERAKQLMLDPMFEVGNHAWTHGNLRVLHGQRMRDQIVWTQAQYLLLRDELARDCRGPVGHALIEQIPRVPSTFRFPYGTCDSNSLAALDDLGLAAVQWDIVTGDPARNQTASGIASAIRKGVRRGRGSIAIMHANGRGRATAEAVRQIVPELLNQGVQFMTVSELLQAGQPHAVDTCYEVRPGDNKRYDALFGEGTGE